SDEVTSPPADAAPTLPRAVGSALFAATGFVIFVLVFRETMSFSPAARPFPALISIIGMFGAAIAFAQSCLAALAARRRAGAKAGGGGRAERARPPDQLCGAARLCGDAARARLLGRIGDVPGRFARDPRRAKACARDPDHGRNARRDLSRVRGRIRHPPPWKH